jgi:hypothetical protein
MSAAAVVARKAGYVTGMGTLNLILKLKESIPSNAWNNQRSVLIQSVT